MFANNIWSLHQMAQGPAQQLPNLHPDRLTSSFAVLERDLSLLSQKWAFFCSSTKQVSPHLFFFAALSTQYTTFFPSCLLYLLLPRLLCWQNYIIREMSGILIDLNSKYSACWIAWHSTQRQVTVTGHSGYLREELDQVLLWLARTMKMRQTADI